MKPIERTMPYISFIVARSSPGDVIGCENKLPWHLRTDLKFFRKVTEGHAVIMGRKTYESIGRPLPNRMNIIISKSSGAPKSGLIWTTSREDALYQADIYSIANDKSEIIVIGGAQIYDVFSDLFNKVYLTEIFHEFKDGDAHFRSRFDRREWEVVDSVNYDASEHDDYKFRISILKRRNKYVRSREISEFYVGNTEEELSKFLPRLREKLKNRSFTDDSPQTILPLLVA